MTALRQFFDRLLTHSRRAAFLGWVIAVWAALEAQGALTWPLTREQWITIVGATLAWLGRSGLAEAKRPPQEPQV